MLDGECILLSANRSLSIESSMGVLSYKLLNNRHYKHSKKSILFILEDLSLCLA